MNTMISFTFAQLCQFILALSGGVVGISAAVGVIISIVKRAKTPTDMQNKRLDELEERVSRHDELFIKDNKRLEYIEDGNRVTQRSILALLSHGIDGNEIEEMKKAKNELTEFLIKR